MENIRKMLFRTFKAYLKMLIKNFNFLAARVGSERDC